MLTDRKWVALGAVFLLLTTFVGVGVAAPAQAAGATATLSGTVFYDDLPTKHVQGGYSVALHLPHSIDPAVLYVSTDDDGRFEIAGIAPGTYEIRISAPTESWVLGNLDGDVIAHPFPDIFFTFAAGQTVNVNPHVPFERNPLSPTVERIAGADRYETSVALSQFAFPTAPVVFLASGADFPDALSAGPAAAHLGGPLLLTSKSALPSAVASEIRRLGPTRVVVVGGPAVVDDAVIRAVEKMGIAAERVFGPDRYATSVAVARFAFTTCASSYVATGRTFADALSLAGRAGMSGDPLLLVDGQSNAAPSAVKAVIRDLQCAAVSIAGGTAAVSSGIERDLSTAAPYVHRYAGTDRYDTSRLITDRGGVPTRMVLVVSGSNFPDGLAAGAAAGVLFASVYISQYSCVPGALGQQLLDSTPAFVAIVGGHAALSGSVDYPNWWGACPEVW